MCKKYGKTSQAADDNVILRMRIACFIIKAANTHSECVIVTALSRQLWLQERASFCVYTYFACLGR